MACVCNARYTGGKVHTMEYTQGDAMFTQCRRPERSDRAVTSGLLAPTL